MAAKIIDGKKIADELLSSLHRDVSKQVKAGQRQPGLAVVKVGKNPASIVYVRNKIKACEKVGVKSFSYELEEETDTEFAAMQIYKVSSSIRVPLIRFYDSDKKAMEDDIYC